MSLPYYRLVRIVIRITLQNVFNQVRAEIGAKPILSKQLAKGALAWIPNKKLVNQIQDVKVHNTPLMYIVRNVHNNVSEQ